MIKISVQDFAIPTPRTGSLEVGGGFSLGMQRGIELHLARQRFLKKKFSEYQAEKKITHTFERDGRKFLIEGRIDGFFPGMIPKIEEIKSTVNLNELHDSLRKNLYGHPYGLQLLSYGYFFWKESGIIPELSFHLISSRNEKVIDLSIELNVSEFELWLDKRLELLSQEAKRAEKNLERRKKLAANLEFPFHLPRPGQVELIEFIENGFKDNKNLMLQAPTGLGKTIGVLYPGLKEALPRGQKVIYITPKNSQQLVAEEAIEKIQEKGCKVRALTLTAKSKICMKDEPLCHPENCEYALDYYDKFEKNELRNLLLKKKKLTSRTFRKIAEEYLVCPFELQLEAMADTDAVIGDYNHVFGNQSALGRINLIDHAQSGKPNLVIDEAHNLPARTMSHYSPAISSSYLEQMASSLDHKGRGLVKECQNLVMKYSSGAKKVVQVEAEEFINLNDKLKQYLSAHANEADASFQGILKLSFLWSEFTDILEFALDEKRPEFFISHYPDPHGGVLKITCCDASLLIQSRYQDFEHVVAFSATLKPFAYYAQLTGLTGEKLNTAEFVSPYEKKNRKIVLIPQISTKFSDRERNYTRIAEVISRISSLKTGNYLVFFPSFDFLEKTAAHLLIPTGFKLIKQTRSMAMREVENTLSLLRSEEIPTLLFAVQGGMFSEGIDYPGSMVIGAFIIGPPLPNFDFERERMKDYYQSTYQEGFEYAYSYPAMAKAVQAAGRVIRSENDRGIIILMDNRFLETSYTQTMPEGWFEQTAHELVSQSILSEIQDFWSES